MPAVTWVSAARAWRTLQRSHARVCGRVGVRAKVWWVGGWAGGGRGRGGRRHRVRRTRGVRFKRITLQVAVVRTRSTAGAVTMVSGALPPPLPVSHPPPPPYCIGPCPLVPPAAQSHVRVAGPSIAGACPCLTRPPFTPALPPHSTCGRRPRPVPPFGGPCTLARTPPWLVPLRSQATAHPPPPLPWPAHAQPPAAQMHTPP